MSRQADESRNRPTNTSGNKKKTKKKGGSVQTFTPNESQKELIKSGKFTSSQAISYLQEICERGCNLSLGVGDRDLNAYAMIRQRTEDWTEAWCLSVWHNDLETAIKALALCLKDAYPEFPENRPIEAWEPIDW